MVKSIDLDYTPGNKRKRRFKSCGDLISELPDEIVGHILSGLSTKDAMKTSVLSQNWKYKWTFVYKIDIRYNFRDYIGKRYDEAYFLGFVDRVLHMTPISTIKRFRFSCDRVERSDHLVTWIGTLCNVEKLVIIARNIKSIVLPRSFSICSSLKDLKLLFSCIIEVPIDTCFSNLEKLFLGGECGIRAKLLNGSASTRGRLSLNFPVLKVLDLISCEWLDVDYVEILAPALIEFKTCCLPGMRNYKIKISAANLVWFESSQGSIDDFVLNTPRVTYAGLYDHNLENVQLIDRACLTLKAFPILKSLKISGGVVQALLRSNSGLVFRNLEQLKKVELCYSCCLKNILELLNELPPLERLKLDMCNWDNYSQEEHLPLRIISCLKEIELVSFRGTKGQFCFTKFVTENAKNLVRVSVSGSLDPAVPNIGNRLRKLKPRSSTWELVFTNSWFS